MAALHCIGVGDAFLQLVRVLYTQLMAHSRVYGIVTGPIDIARSTRQDYPLLPLSYALMAEEMACTLRECHAHRGLRFPHYNLIISAYTDDTLLYVRYPKH
ncbi:hypothetical protein NDU88_004875 [Pleurodeles waltl]|uniref:Reverse transcriptase n=1 Tax=Pleurodeles waltl TaxID=8319 RepID=A0AAV7NM91_PLEWA|nr:hypothetical protein NDU88_004875 [Pleurodeles waltl]